MPKNLSKRFPLFYFIAILSMTLMSQAAAQGTLFSVNAVGFVRPTFEPGFTAAVNPLDNGQGNRVEHLFDEAPVGATIFVPGPSGRLEFAARSFFGWLNGDMELPPGRGFYVKNPGTNSFIITFVGNVLHGDLTLELRPGLSLVGGLVPQSGLLSTDLGFRPNVGDIAYVFDSTQITANQYTYTELGWNPFEPAIRIAQAFWISTTQTNQWTRRFNVNDPGPGSAGSPGPSFTTIYPMQFSTNGIYNVEGFTNQAPRIPQPELDFVGRNLDGTIEYRVFTEAGRAYEIQSSPDLANWSLHQTFTASSATFHFNSGPASAARRYYRVVTQ